MTVRLAMAGLALVGTWFAVVPDIASGQRRQRDLITREEILNSAQSSGDLLQVVRSLRPHFLQAPRGIRTMGGTATLPPMLILDGARAGELDGLRMIAAQDVEEVRYLDPARAQNQFGAEVAGGAVLVKMYKGPGRDTIPPPNEPAPPPP